MEEPLDCYRAEDAPYPCHPSPPASREKVRNADILLAPDEGCQRPKIGYGRSYSKGVIPLFLRLGKDGFHERPTAQDATVCCCPFMSSPHRYHLCPSSLASQESTAGKIRPSPQGDSLFDETAVTFLCFPFHPAEIGEDGIPILPRVMLISDDTGVAGPGIDIELIHVLDDACP